MEDVYNPYSNLLNLYGSQLDYEIQARRREMERQQMVGQLSIARRSAKVVEPEENKLLLLL